MCHFLVMFALTMLGLRAAAWIGEFIADVHEDLRYQRRRDAERAGVGAGARERQ